MSGRDRDAAPVPAAIQKFAQAIAALSEVHQGGWFGESRSEPGTVNFDAIRRSLDSAADAMEAVAVQMRSLGHAHFQQTLVSQAN